jgi:hypothetical protein
MPVLRRIDKGPPSLYRALLAALGRLDQLLEPRGIEYWL